jgi:hypothetical protein
MTPSPLPGHALVYTYRRVNRFMAAVASRVFESSVTCASLPGLETLDLQPRFAERFRTGRGHARGFSLDDYLQVVTRCRVLRLLPWERAVRMVDAMYGAIDEVFDQEKPRYVWSTMVDCYVNDLIARVAQARGVRVVMICAGVFPNTIQVTSYGEFTPARQPPPEEVEAGVHQLADDAGVVTYGTARRRYTLGRHVLNHARWWAKRAYFDLMARSDADRLNFWYLQHVIRDADGHSRLANHRCSRYFHQDWRPRLDAATRPTIYMPLAHTPESSTDYWLRDLRYVAYEAFVVRAVQELSATHQVVLKDHWSVMGQRDWTFYDRLATTTDAILVPPETSSRALTALCDVVLVGAGTTGPEAAVRGKTVVTLDRPYYFLEGCYLDLGSADGLATLPERLRGFRAPAPSHEHSVRIVERMLQTSLRGTFLLGDVLDTEENVAQSARSLRDYLEAS